MTILASELKEYQAENMSDTPASNGGYMSATEITSNVKENVFPNVTQAQRTAGVTQHRKVFHKIANDDDETLSNSRIFMTQVALGDDYTSLIEGTQTDVESGISGREYGVGTLKTNISAGGSSLVVVLENSGLTIFVNADTIYITDGTNSEFHENVTINKVGDEVTITLDGGDTFVNSYLSATPTYIASVIEVGSIEASYDSWVENAGGGGTYDETTYPPELDNIGTVEDAITISFNLGDGVNFSCSGAKTGSMGTGNTGSDFAPNNANFTKPYFTLRSAGWAGGWQSGDSITFSIQPASHPVWRKRITPAGATALSSDSYKVMTYGETS